MSKPKRHEKKGKVPDISKNISKFKELMFGAYGSKFEQREDPGQYVVFHGRLHFEERERIDFIIYTTDRVFISGSPLIPPDFFDGACTKILTIALNSTKKLEDERPLTLRRAKTILSFASTLKLDQEMERIVAVVLADISNEIVLTEKMKSENISGQALDAGIPKKIKYLEEKIEVVYKTKEICNTRELRNGIVHKGNIPTKDQAEETLKIANDVLSEA